MHHERPLLPYTTTVCARVLLTSSLVNGQRCPRLQLHFCAFVTIHPGNVV